MTDKASDATLEKLMRDLEIAGRNVSTPDVLAARSALREYLSEGTLTEEEARWLIGQVVEPPNIYPLGFQVMVKLRRRASGKEHSE